MVRPPEMMQVFISLKQLEEVGVEDKSLRPFWGGVDSRRIEEYAKNGVQGVMLSGLDPSDVDKARQLIEESGFRYEQEIKSPEDAQYIPLLNLTAIYGGTESYIDALRQMCELANKIDEECQASLPGF